MKKTLNKLLLILSICLSFPLSAAMVDGSFERGLVPNSAWTPASTFGGIQDFPLCGSDNSCPAAGVVQTGAWAIWIGGLSGGITSSVEQSVLIENNVSNITLWAFRGLCDDPSDTVDISIDATIVGSIVCDDVDDGMVEYMFDITAGGFNDDAMHTINISGTVGGTNGSHSNFFIDDVGLDGVLPVELINFSID